MYIALFLATEDIYFRNGVLNLPYQKDGCKIFDFDDFLYLYKESALYEKSYVVCDRNNYILFNAIFSERHVVCVDKNDVIFFDGSLIIATNYFWSTHPILYNLNRVEKIILYLYIVQGMKFNDIAVLTNLNIKKVYYRIRTIKQKLGVKTTKKLLALYREHF